MGENVKQPVLTHRLDVELGFRVFRTNLSDPLSSIQVEYANGNRRPAVQEELMMYNILKGIFDQAPEPETEEAGPTPTEPQAGPEELRCNPQELG